jgi:hypothetical protein
MIEDHHQSLAKHRFMLTNHYRLVDRTGYNQWYVPSHEPFPLQPRTSSLELVRKMYLSHPFRELKQLWRGKRRR